MEASLPRPTLPSREFGISYGPNDDRLHGFYIPALEASVRFDRTTGFFSSAALAIAAAGIVRLIHNGGRMRLLCGAKLSEDDVAAVKRGEELSGVVERSMVGSLADPSDQSLRARLEALAWLVAHDRLEMRVVLPRGKHGFPLPADQAREYYHPKEGLFEDAEGNKLAFSGSANDSQSGWQWNYETFMVFATWPRQEGSDVIAASSLYVSQIEGRFRRLWEGKEEDWIALDIPEAARLRLLSYAPAVAPTRDALEKEERRRPAAAVAPEVRGGPPDLERLVFYFLREAPHLPNASALGLGTGNVVPWPHQQRVVDAVVARYPESFLFCDEVGLGKTIEAGLALRQLVISGRVKRALLLVPASVLRQWQEELWEKCVLNVPRYDGGAFTDVFGRILPDPGGNPWAAYPLLLASSQLAKRAERQAEVIGAGPWDLVLVDEAHHARRKDFKEDRRRPNRLLELLEGAAGHEGINARARCLYLMTATPMQVAAVEVWDLLRVLGLGGRWGAAEGNFLRYFRELREPFAERDWDFVLGMVRDYLDTGGTIDPTFADAARERLGVVDWESIRGLPHSHKRTAQIHLLDTNGRACLEAFAHHHTPLRTYMWRNTRGLLRRYRDKGIIQETIPRRRPQNVWISLTAGPGAERELYDRIEEYITDFYQVYEAERKGLGFVMTVYRRRLTSSFHALRLSLERRRAFLRGQTTLGESLGVDDVEQEDLDEDITETIVDEDRSQAAQELQYVEDFLHALAVLGTDSKLERLISDLNRIFLERDTVIIFTQYTDTMDYLRERLRGVYGQHIACYSGRGGERWDGVGWMPRTKEDIKTAFREQDVKILLCTESASEGLNLQTCGVLINYDMPWNPMRVEQRIGRIDRIGQTFQEVWIYNYFYEETVEATVYQRLEDRISWFEDVVGELQPILHRVASVIQNAAMLGRDARSQRLEEALAQIRADIDNKATEGLNLDAYLEQEPAAVQAALPPVTLKELESALLTSETLRGRFSPHPTLPNAHMLSWDGGKIAVTFDPALFDQHPDSLQLLSYGNPLLDELLAAVPQPAASERSAGIGFFSAREPAAISMFVAATDDGVTELPTLGSLIEAARQPSLWDDAAVAEAEARFSTLRRQLADHLGDVKAHQLQAERLALQEEARQILVHTALLLAAQGQKMTLDDEPQPFLFGAEAVEALRNKGKPYKGLWVIAGTEDLDARADDPYYFSIQNLGTKSREQKLLGLRSRGMEVLRRYRLLQAKMEEAEACVQLGPCEVEERWFAPEDAEWPA